MGAHHSMVRSRMKEKNKRKLSQLQLENNFILSIRKGLLNIFFSPHNNMHGFILLFVPDDKGRHPKKRYKE